MHPISVEGTKGRLLMLLQIDGKLKMSCLHEAHTCEL
jgi:hypothetical protein